MPYPPRRRFSERLFAFFAGRYGADTIYYFLFVESLICLVLGAVFRSLLLNGISLLLLLYALWRAMSRNVWKRQRENLRFRRFLGRLRAPFSRAIARVRYRKTHVFRRCPSCKNHLRLPKKKGQHTVRCPRCNRLFDTVIR